MKAAEIKDIALGLRTKSDLLKLINTLKQEELGVKYRPFTMKQLGYYCNPNNVHHRYYHFTIPKKSGGERCISAPDPHSYMHLLRYVGQILQSIYSPSAHAMGFIIGRSIVHNATAHVGMNYVFNLDLKNFFPSIERARIVARLQVRPFCFTQEVALTIAGLCCMRIDNAEDKEHPYKYVLPQGSPASPIITNLMCDKLDYLLAGLAKRFNINYTRYADDLTFSSMHNVYQEGCEFRNELERIIRTQRFTVNDKKTRLHKVGSRQEVTGLTVSADKVNVARKYIRDLRGLLFIWEKYGYAVAENRLRAHNAADKTARRKGSSLVCVLSGKLMFLKMVKGDNDPTYLALRGRFDALITKQEKKQPQHTKLHYRETYRLSDFEKQNHTEIQYVNVTRYKREAHFMFNGTETVARVEHSVDVRQPKGNLCISFCDSDTDAYSFWLIHKPYKSQYYKDIVDIDRLNKELDEALNLPSELVPDDPDPSGTSFTLAYPDESGTSRGLDMEILIL